MNEEERQRELKRRQQEAQKEEEKRLAEEEERRQEEAKKASLTAKALKAYKTYKNLKKISQMKIIASVASALAPVLVILMKIIIVVALIFIVISVALSFIDGIYSMGDRFYNLFRIGELRGSEDVFFQTLEREHKRYHRFPNREGELDIALIMSTVNYAKIMEPEGFDFEQFVDDYFDEEETSFLSYLPKDTVRSYYKVMNDELGEIYTLNPLKKGLLGHLVGVKIGNKCVNAPGFNLDVFNDLRQLGNEVVDSLDEAKMLFETIFDLDNLELDELPDEAYDVIPGPLEAVIKAYSRTPAGETYGKLIVLMANIRAYHEIQEGDLATDYLAAWWNRATVSVETQNFIAVLSRMIEASAEEGIECGSGELSIPTIVLYQDYELYRYYLVNHFIKVYYAQCPKCAYRGLDDDDPLLEIAINRMADEIFMMRDMYLEYMPMIVYDDDPDAFAFPGMTAFIFEPEKCTVPTTYELVLRARDSSIMSNMREPHGPPHKTGPYGGCVTNSFGNRLIRGNISHHVGVDFGLPNRVELYAMASGRVITSSRQSITYLGYYVEIDHGEIDGNRYISRYLHMFQPSPLQVGDEVYGGQYIGLSGDTGAPPGHQYGAHLHFDLRRNGAYVNPVPYLREILEGTSQFETGGGGQYYLMSDFDAAYCEGSDKVSNIGQLPTAYAMMVTQLADETSPDQVANYICNNMEDNRDSILWSSAAANNFGVHSTKISGTMASLTKNLDNDRKIIVKVSGGPFAINRENYLVIVGHRNNKYLVLDPMSRNNSQSYEYSQVQSRILNYVVDENIYSFASTTGESISLEEFKEQVTNDPYYMASNSVRYNEYFNKTQNSDIRYIVSVVNSGADRNFYDSNFIKTADTTGNQNAILVNKFNKLPSNFNVGNIVDVDFKYSRNDARQSLTHYVYEEYKRMWYEAERDGIKLELRSGYRSYATQESLYNSYVARHGREQADTFSARPGHSEHQLGLALDIVEVGGSLRENFENTKEFKWLKDNAHKYGFILRYPRPKAGEPIHHVTGYTYEPWHWRYVGRVLANEYHQMFLETGITFDEYHAFYLR